MSKPIENCPVEEKPMRDRAWTAEQVQDYADACRLLHKGPVIADMLDAFAATLRQQGEQPEDSRCPATYRREGAVKTLIGLGWAWDGKWWISPPTNQQAEQAGGVVSALNGQMLQAGADALEQFVAWDNADDETRYACIEKIWRDMQAIAPLLRAPAETESKVYACPRCATSMQVDPSAKPRAPAEQGGRMDKGMVSDEAVSAAIYAAERSSNATRIGWKTMRAALQAALAQNAQGEETIWCMQCGKHTSYSECDNCPGNSGAAHAERARVPDAYITIIDTEIANTAPGASMEHAANHACLKYIKQAMFAAAPPQPEDAA